MNQEKGGGKDKRKILVEFDVPDKFSHYTKEDFENKFRTLAYFLEKEWEVSSELFYSAKSVRLSDLKTYDTIP